MQKYSEFINFPIYLYDSKEIEVPAKEEEASAKTKSDDEISDEGEIPVHEHTLTCQIIPTKLCTPGRHAPQSYLGCSRLLSEERDLVSLTPGQLIVGIDQKQKGGWLQDL